MNYNVKYEYFVRVLKANGKIRYKNAFGFLYLKNDQLYASFNDVDNISIDSFNIKYASIEMFMGGNLHVYRITI